MSNDNTPVDAYRQYVYRTQNKIIYIQPDSDLYELILKDIARPNHHVHVFELLPTAVLNILTIMVESIHPTSKVIIHVPRFMKDYARLLGHQFQQYSTNWRVVIDDTSLNSMVYFPDRSKKRSYDGVAVYWTIGNETYSIESAVVYSNQPIVRSSADIGKRFYESNHPWFTSMVQRHNPDLFKDKIVGNFKRSTPKGILDGFADDNDIWDYIVENCLSPDEDESVEDED